MVLPEVRLAEDAFWRDEEEVIVSVPEVSREALLLQEQDWRRQLRFNKLFGAQNQKVIMSEDFELAGELLNLTIAPFPGS